jgi:hypothetical protein
MQSKERIPDGPPVMPWAAQTPRLEQDERARRRELANAASPRRHTSFAETLAEIA